MEQSGDDTHLQLYDLRSTQPKAKPVLDFVDAHSDDVTHACDDAMMRRCSDTVQVVFHPRRPGVLMSGSTDGLVNVYDALSAADDIDDRIVQTLNSESSVVREPACMHLLLPQ